MRRLSIVLCLLAMAAGPLPAQEEYPLGPDSQRQPGVPQGSVTHYTWTSGPNRGGQTFPGTERDYWVYVPSQYTPDKAACVMVFQDGEGFIKEDGRARIPIVFDNLIAKHEMPVTIGIFINPGVLKALSPDQQSRFNRSFEYDGLGDRYARFLLDEILHEVAKHHNLSTKPDDRAVAGLSSGGICAFTAAWNRPDAFHRVLSFIGSFTDLRGGDIYPALIRKTEPKPLRVFLQDGSHDLNIYAGDWWMANQSMASALEYAGYDVKFVTGDKDHDMEQGGAILPDALRWLWRDYPQPFAKPAPNHSGDKRTAILDPASHWISVPIPPRGIKITNDWSNSNPGTGAGLAVDAAGEVVLSDVFGRRIVKVGADGTVSTLIPNAPASLQLSRSMGFGPDGQLYSCERGRISAYSLQGKRRTFVDGAQCQDLALTHEGGVYFTDFQSVWYVDRSGRRKIVYPVWAQLTNFPAEVTPMPLMVRGWRDWARSREQPPVLLMSHPNEVRLSLDQSLLFVDDPESRWVWSFQVQADGSLTGAERFYHLETGDDSPRTGAAGMTVDSQGYLYVATELGIQVCDQPGRVLAIINSPAPGPLLGVKFGGPDLQDLYVVAGERLYKRHLLRKGVLPWVLQKPPVPQL